MRQRKVTGKAKRSPSVDEQLLDHLKKAEHHIVEAMVLFTRKTPPKRRPDYLTKLTRHQEGISSLLREELVLKRGHMTPKGKVRK